MAAYIFHGSPGSYKTSSAIWFEMLGALRQGRIVVTNIEGMKPIQEIQDALGETFPDGAEIWRLSSQKDKGRELWRSFFHWAPIGAMLIIDEVQDVFPTERSFKPENYDYVNVAAYEQHLPAHWYSKHFELLDSIKPSDLTSADIDDLEQILFDDNGHIIYPSTLKESFMRHRKYNWDIVVCTPDITQVNTLIRGACEMAFNHRSNDSFGKIIPYYKRRPRIRQHNPKESGLVAKKSDIVTNRKVPVDVHKLYKSTATGKINASGVGATPLSSPAVIFSLLCIFAAFSYSVYAFSGIGEDDETALQPITETNSNGNQVNRVNNGQGSSFSGSANNPQASLAVIVDVIPFPVNDLFYTGYEVIRVSDNDFKTIYFSTKGKFSETITSTDLRSFGIQTMFIRDCFVKLSYKQIEHLVTCDTTIKKAEQPTNSDKPKISIL